MSEVDTDTLDGWLAEGGDDRLVDYTPLTTLTPIINMFAAMEKRGDVSTLGRH